MSTLQVNTINESTSTSGVTIDGVLLKDSKIGGTITIPGSTGTMALTSDITSGLAEADLWQITAHASSTGTLTSNWARPSGTLIAYNGTGMTESSGIFTFANTGYYLVQFTCSVADNSGADKDIFGTPTFIINNKIFWGQDRLEYALEELNAN